MFLKHSAAFDTFTPAAQPERVRHGLTVSAGTLIETEQGWRRADALRLGDGIATLDGGFARLDAVASAAATPLVHVPGGTLSACSDVLLPQDAHVALDLPAALSDAPLVSVPLVALIGWRGIGAAPAGAARCVTLTLPEEEMVYAQTGLLVHTRSENGFFERKSYGETRALLALMDGGLPAPAQAVAA